MKNFIKNLFVYKVLLSFIWIMNTATMQPASAESSSSSEQEIALTSKPIDSIKNNNHKYESIIINLEGHLNDDFPTSHENKFAEFLQKDLVDAYPVYKQAIVNGLKESTEQIQTGSQGNTYDAQEDAWVNSTGPFINSGFANYTTHMINRLKQDFMQEFTPLDNLLNDLRENIYKMSIQELKQIQSLKALTLLEARLKHYKNAFQQALPEIEKKYQINALSPAAPQTTLPGSVIITFQGSEAIVRYKNAHKEFIKTLTADVGDKIESLLRKITEIKRSAKRNEEKNK